jgi:hypothetical protein
MFKKVLSFSFLIAASFSAVAFNVTFRVDMSQQTDFTTPEVNGSFNEWCGNCFPMTDTDGDNIWEATTNLDAGTYEYKFSADAWLSQETLLQGSACTVTNFGYTNRTLSVTADAVLPVVCWGSCTDCASSPNIYTVEFQVDMNGVTGFTTPEVNGTFNGWCGNCTVMSDPDGDNIWSVAVTLQEGAYEYKFSHDNWGGQENLVPGSPCTITMDQFTNRTIVVDGNITLEPVCWGSCAACGQSTGPYNVTFAVDMSQFGLPFTTPEVNGTFNNWCGSCAPMSDIDGDNIWTLTIALPVGVHSYKFSYDNWAGQEELIPGSPCTLTETDFTNRTIDINDTAVLPTVCWGSCEACAVNVNEFSQGELLVFPNPVQDVMTIALSEIGNSEITVSDMTGRIAMTSSIRAASQTQLRMSELPAGTYIVAIRNDRELLRRVVQVVK